MTMSRGQSCAHHDGCAAACWAPYAMCLAHLDTDDLAGSLADLAPGAAVDARGVTFTRELLARLCSALTAPGEPSPRFGASAFDGARFIDDAIFEGAEFNGQAGFASAHFHGSARFDGVRFSRDTAFGGARFAHDARFYGAHFGGAGGFGETWFHGDAVFEGAVFAGKTAFSGTRFASGARFYVARFDSDATFDAARFTGDARFGRVRFTKDTDFSEAQFAGRAEFNEASFSGAAVFRGTRCARTVLFDAARFEGDWLGPLLCEHDASAWRVKVMRPVHLRLAARRLDLSEAQFEGPAVLNVRDCLVNLSGVVAHGPLTILTSPEAFDAPDPSRR